MTTCQGSALLLGIEHLDVGDPDRMGVASLGCADGCDSEPLRRLLGAELHTDPMAIERAA